MDHNNIQQLYFMICFLLAAVSYECWFPYGGVPAGKMGPQESGDSNHVCWKDVGTTGHSGKGDKEAQVKFRAIGIFPVRWYTEEFVKYFLFFYF